MIGFVCRKNADLISRSENTVSGCNLGASCYLIILAVVLKGKCARGAFRDVVRTSPRHSLLLESHTVSQYTKKCHFTHDL